LAAVALFGIGCAREPAGPVPADKADDPVKVDRNVEALVIALQSDELSEIVAAADALKAIGPEASPAADALAARLDHEQPWIRTACMDALGAIGAKAVPALSATVRNGPGNAPIRAAIVLGAIGPEAKDATAAFEEVIEGVSEDRRARWEELLAKIDPTRTGGTPDQPDVPGADSAGVVLPESAIIPIAAAEDWPQFHGPGRDSICRETGLLSEWPEGGPKLLWKLQGLGLGYSNVSIAGGKIFTMGDQQRDDQGQSQFVVAYDLATRKKLWATRVGEPFTGGPRCTPTVSGQLLYALGTDGGLVCLAKETGSVVWKKNLRDDFGGKMMSGWKYCESPLIDGDRLVCTPGGDDAAIVALDKLSGELIWKCAVPQLGPRGKDGAAYSSVVVAEIAGVRQYVQLLGRGVVGVDADSGRFLWGYNAIANEVANITAPVVRGNYVFVTTSYARGGALLEIVHDGDAFEAKQLYSLRPRDFENHHGGVVLLGNHLYAGSGQNRGDPVCLDLATGQIAWKQRPLGRGSASVLYADGHLIFRYDRGLVALVEATPEEFRLKGTFQPESADGPAWPHPVIHDGTLYLRHNDLLLCYDLHASG
jgi:outer membrane protein assembly factor BamB